LVTDIIEHFARLWGGLNRIWVVSIPDSSDLPLTLIRKRKSRTGGAEYLIVERCWGSHSVAYFYSNADFWKDQSEHCLWVSAEVALAHLAVVALALPGIKERPRTVSAGWKLPPLRSRSVSDWRQLGVCSDPVWQEALRRACDRAEEEYGQRPDPEYGFLPDEVPDNAMQQLLKTEIEEVKAERPGSPAEAGDVTDDPW